MLNNKSILITGGTGSFGKKFIEIVLKRYKPKKIIIYSRDELKQFEMQQKWPFRAKTPFRYFIGDVRDLERLKVAMKGVDIVIHAAALKQVPIGEYNPFEVIKTNVMGAQNVIDASIYSGVKKVIALSTDKAAAPINLYGATKLASDKLFVAANNHIGVHKLGFSVVRYGNVMASRGSVVPSFLSCAKSGVLPITHREMTRFNITLKEGVDLVLHVIEHAEAGEVYVPRIPSYRVVDLAEAIGPSCRKEVVGIRPGEKLHEEMITSSDSYSTVDLGTHFIILPQSTSGAVERFKQRFPTEFVEPGFSYNSKDNRQFLSVDDIRNLILEHVDSQFEPF